MRILHVITDLRTGGVPLHLYRLARHLHERGDQVRVVSLSPPGPVTGLLGQAGVAVGACDAAGWWDARVFPRLAAAIRTFRPQVVHALLFHANLAARVACPLAGVDPRRLICEIQTVEIERRWHLAVDRLTQGGCRLVVGNSPAVIEHLARRAGIARSRLRLIRGGVDAEAIATARPLDRAELGLHPGTPLVLWVGRLDPIKGLDVLLDAVTIARHQHAVQLAIVGDGPLAGELGRAIRAGGLGDVVHLLGARHDVPRLLRTADVFCFPSRTEGLPNALIEAMAAGLPVVTTNAPGCRDLVEHGRTGWLVPVDDARAAGAALVRLLRDPALASRLGAAAAGHVSRNLSLKQCFENYRALYREVCRSLPATGNAARCTSGAV